MGYWGKRSYQNDACMDEIPKSFLENKSPTARQITNTLQKVFNPLKHFYSVYEKMEIRLGSVIYFLETQKHPAIDDEYLKKAIAYANSLKNNSTYISNWKVPEARRKQLEKEIQILKKAQNEHA